MHVSSLVSCLAQPLLHRSLDVQTGLLAFLVSSTIAQERTFCTRMNQMAPAHASAEPQITRSTQVGARRIRALPYIS